MRAIIISGAVLTLLTVAKAIFPSLPFLPLGGSSIAEMGIVLGTAVAISTITGLGGDRNDKN